MSTEKDVAPEHQPEQDPNKTSEIVQILAMLSRVRNPSDKSLTDTMRRMALDSLALGQVREALIGEHHDLEPIENTARRLVTALGAADSDIRFSAAVTALLRPLRRGDEQLLGTLERVIMLSTSALTQTVSADRPQSTPAPLAPWTQEDVDTTRAAFAKALSQGESSKAISMACVIDRMYGR